MKVKSKRSKTNLGLPIVVLLCLLFLLAGFFGSMILSQVFCSLSLFLCVCVCVCVIVFGAELSFGFWLF